LAAILRVIRAALGDLWDDLFTTAVCNLLWLLAQVLILPGPPATLALFYTTNRLARGEVTDVGDFLRALRRWWGLGWRWGLANLLALVLLGGDFYLTGRLSQSNFARLAQGFYLAVLAGWLLLQLFALPFLFEQQQPGLRQAWRNAASMIGRNPGFALGVGLLAALVLAAGTALFLLSGAAGAMFTGLVGSHAVLDRLREYREREMGKEVYK
jgi:hypothetical protein